VTEVNTFTKIYLCFFGQYDYDAVPAIPPRSCCFRTGLVQYLRNFFLVARHSGAAFDLLREETVQEDSRRDGCGRTFRWRARQVAHAFALGEEVDFVAQFLFGAGPHYPLGGAFIYPSATLSGFAAGGEVDAGALRDERRAGRDLSLDDERHHRAALPGYSVDDPQFIRAMDEFEKLGIEEGDTFRMQPCLSPVWIRRMRCLRWARRGFRRRIRGW